MDNYHISKEGHEWKFQRADASLATGRADTQEKIILFMQEYMVGKDGVVEIYQEDGSILEERIYSDSCRHPQATR
ncbi:MAG: DUF2188 domain-containing protein [Halomonas sp.]|nr:DUF2188 domain-containing protein [Halomonas sp.]MBL1266231.1 DUF2188 domain-containing protein [Halomonas sp.]